MAKPAIYYDNRFDDATPTASTTATGYAVANLTDWRPYTWWKPTAIPATVTVDCGAAKAADYALVAGHDLGSTGHRIQVRGSTDNFSASDVLVASKATDSDSPLLATFTSAEYRYWRLLVAEANLLTYSEQFDNAAWTSSDGTTTANAMTAPDGTLTADRFTASAGAAFHYWRRTSSQSYAAGKTYAYSRFIRRVNNDWLWIGFTDAQLSYINIATKAVGTQHANVSSIVFDEDYPDGWVRVGIVGQPGAVSGTPNLGVTSGNGVGSFTAVGTEAVDSWGAQLEEVAAGTTEPGPYVATGATTTSGTPSLAIAAIGSAFELYTYLPQGFDPTGRQVESSVNRNANGQPLGRVIDYERWEQTITQQSIPWAWVRSTFEPAWVAHLRSSPFGFCWEPSSYADEVRLVVAGARFDTPHRSGLLADLSFEVSGVLE